MSILWTTEKDLSKKNSKQLLQKDFLAKQRPVPKNQATLQALHKVISNRDSLLCSLMVLPDGQPKSKILTNISLKRGEHPSSKEKKKGLAKTL
jgi:hypothetical protein